MKGFKYPSMKKHEPLDHMQWGRFIDKLEWPTDVSGEAACKSSGGGDESEQWQVNFWSVRGV